MDWNAIGAVGEVGGAIGVVATLVYLAGQLRQNTYALRTATYQGYNEAAFSFADSQMEHHVELSRILQMTRYEELTPEQASLFMPFVFKTFTLIETNYLHHRAGAMDDDVFEAHIAGSATFVAQFNIIREAWQQSSVFGTSGLTPGFIEYFNGRLDALQEAGEVS